MLSLVYLQALVALDHSVDASGKAAGYYLLVFPTSFFLSAVYSESLFLALALAAFYYSRKSSWLIACSCAGLATLTRSQGVLLVIPLLVEYFAQREFDYRRGDRCLLYFTLIPAALLALVCYFRYEFGNWTIIFEAQQPWSRRLMWPWQTLAWIFRTIGTPLFHSPDLIDLTFYLGLILLGLLSSRRLRLSYSVFAWLSIAFFGSWGMLGSVRVLPSPSSLSIAFWPLTSREIECCFGQARARRFFSSSISFFSSLAGNGSRELPDCSGAATR